MAVQALTVALAQRGLADAVAPTIQRKPHTIGTPSRCDSSHRRLAVVAVAKGHVLAPRAVSTGPPGLMRRRGTHAGGGTAAALKLRARVALRPMVETYFST